ncbi:Carboxylesterase 1 [Hondaea fermentalgiana]|uniref:Carboxylesterase 1 n=1 Tax=Hondaea fermentalgiana TaxID=2315210 RepID=A0A2R5GHS7_9STRA|nr:Carboxylesterase 1 [Hondaea fermentalgiana]|eukprot:GBG30440.1 Carboxylesterase 1 [Hondaea fermentalgiana]
MDLFIPEEPFDDLSPHEGGPCLGIRVFRPPKTSCRKSIPVVLFLHGGEFVGGSASDREYHDLCCRFANTGFVVAAPEYRLGSAHPFPAAVEDAYRALAWVVDEDEMPPEADCSRIILVGDSNGGGLVAVLSSLVRDGLSGSLEDSSIQNGFVILHQVIVNGWLFMSETPQQDPLERKKGRPPKQYTFWPGGEPIERTLQVYLPSSVRQDALGDRRCSPWLAGLHDLPCTTVIASRGSPFYKENRRYAERATAMGNAVNERVVNDVHGFLTLAMSPRRDQVLAELLSDLQSMHLSSGSACACDST